MGQKEITILIFATFAAIALMCIGFVFVLLIHRNRKIKHHIEKQVLQHQHKQELLQAQLEMQTQTMQEIGREIHDNVGQKLTLASLYTQQLDYDNKYPEITERVDSISHIINESLEELRSLSKNLTNGYIEEQSLKKLIENEVEKIKLTNRYQLDISIDHSDGYNALTKTILVRIVQEFFQNTMKHADASILSLQLQRKDDGLHLSLRGIGLQNMKKRIALVGGTITIESAANRGTQLHIFIPTEKL
jgi:signal transduction histidine kinase